MSLVAHWQFDGALTDAGGGGRTLLSSGTTTFSSSDKVGSHAAVFGGTNYLYYPSDAALQTSAGSVVFWVNPSSFADYPLLAGCHAAATRPGWAIYIAPSGQVGVQCYTATFAAVDFVASLPMSTGQWHQIALTWAGTAAGDAVKLYQNLVLVGSANASANWSIPAQPISFGDSAVDSFWGGSAAAAFVGFMDDVRYFNRVVTLDDLAQLPGHNIAWPSIVPV